MHIYMTIAFCLAVLFSFSGCAQKQKIKYISVSDCPKLETMVEVDEINVTIVDGKITNRDVARLGKLIGELRRVNSFYESVISDYNKQIIRINDGK